MKLLRFPLTVVFALMLGGCFQVQLDGTVAGSEVTIAPLRQPNNIVVTGTSTAPEYWSQFLGDDKWQQQSGLVQLLLTGFTALKTDAIDPEALYLVKASGGDDYDVNRQKALGDIPGMVQGAWHVIVPGQRILDGNVKVSVLTEALYLQVKPWIDQWTDEELLDRLDAAAQLTVGDVDRSGGVDYADVIAWSRILDARSYRGDLSALNALAESIRAGQPIANRTELAKAVLGSQTVVMSFDVGDVVLETYNWESPITVANFLRYVEEGFYDEMLVHRAINNFMIQAGLLDYLGVDEDGLIQYALQTPRPPIVNESNNGLSNTRGAVAMARTSDPDSAAAQWFINQVDNSFLDYGSSQNPDGYAVFARVVSGISVVDQIAGEPTVRLSGIGNDVPARGVLLEKVEVRDAQE